MPVSLNVAVIEFGRLRIGWMTLDILQLPSKKKEIGKLTNNVGISQIIYLANIYSMYLVLLLIWEIRDFQNSKQGGISFFLDSIVLFSLVNLLKRCLLLKNISFLFHRTHRPSSDIGLSVNNQFQFSWRQKVVTPLHWSINWECEV